MTRPVGATQRKSRKAGKAVGTCLSSLPNWVLTGLKTFFTQHSARPWVLNEALCL